MRISNSPPKVDPRRVKLVPHHPPPSRGGFLFWGLRRGEGYVDETRVVWSYDAFVEQDVIERHRGRWVVVGLDDEVVVEAGSLAELMTKATEQGVHEGTMRRIPETDEPAFIGLS